MSLALTHLIGFGAKRASGGYGAASSAWTATGLSTNDTGYENYSIRVRTTTLAAGGSQIRVRFVASTAASFSCDNCSIGVASGATDATTATPIELLFSGVSGFTITAGNSLVSDWATLTTTTSNAVVVIMDVAASNGNVRYRGSGSGTVYYQSATNSYATAAPGMSDVGLDELGFNLIEVRSAL